MIGFCIGSSYLGILPDWFGLISTPINYYLQFEPSLKFWNETNYKNATSLFWRSLIHLPLLFTAIVIASYFRGTSLFSRNLQEFVSQLLLENKKVMGMILKFVSTLQFQEAQNILFSGKKFLFS